MKITQLLRVYFPKKTCIFTSFPLTKVGDKGQNREKVTYKKAIEPFFTSAKLRNEITLEALSKSVDYRGKTSSLSPRILIGNDDGSTKVSAFTCCKTS